MTKRLLAFTVIALFFLFQTPTEAQFTLSFGTTADSFTASSSGAVTNGIAYALPGNPAAVVTWTTSYSSLPSAITVLLQASLDNSSYFTLDTSTSTAGEIRSITTAARFIRASITAKTGTFNTTVSLVAKANIGTNSMSAATGTLAAVNGGTGSASYTKGDLLCASSATTLTKLGVGADTFLLTADAAQTCGVKWATPNGIVLLEQHTASNSASLLFTTWYSSTYDEYEIHLINIVPVTNTTDFQLQFSTDGGATYVSTGIYQQIERTLRASTNFTEGSASTIGTFFPIVTSVGNSSVGGIVGKIILYAPASGVAYPTATSDINYFNSVVSRSYVARSFTFGSTTPVNAMKFFESSGNLASGIIRIYGVPKS